MNLLIIFVPFSLMGFSHGTVSKEYLDNLVKVVGECKTKHSVGEGMMKKLMARELISEANCFLACMFTDLKLLTTDNKMNTETFMIDNQNFYENDPVNFKKGEHIIQICRFIFDADNCEAAYKLHKCLLEEKKATGIELPF